MDFEHTRHGSSTTHRLAASASALDARLPKLQEDDDIENYLTTFERLAQVYRWPREEWAVHLIPLLTGKARTAFVAMSPASMMDYDSLKEVILKKYEISTETYRLRFRALDTPADEMPMELYVRIKDLFSKWVRFDASTKKDIMETLVLEQYMRVLFPEIRTWVKERSPVTAAEAASFVEAYIAARKGSAGTLRYVGSLQSHGGKSGGLRGSAYLQPQAQILKSTHVKPVPTVAARQSVFKDDVVCYNCAKPGHISSQCPLKKPKSAGLCYLPTPVMIAKAIKVPTVSVLLNGKSVEALIDTGCAQTLVQKQYVPRELWEENTVSICCVHGDKSDLPTAELYIEVNGQPYLMRVGVAVTLPYPVILGTDMPVLADLVQETVWCGVVTRAQARSIADLSQSQDFAQQTLHEMPFFNGEIIADTKLDIEQRLQKRRQWVADAMLTPEPLNVSLEEPDAVDTDADISNELAELQRKDDTLVDCRARADKETDMDLLQSDMFLMKGDILYRQSKEDGTQLVIPKQYRKQILELGHLVPWSGHLGFMKTLMRIAKRFYWPGMYSEVKNFCKTCPECQIIAGKSPSIAPLVPIPAVSTPFERIGVDVVGPLPKSQKGNRLILVICDYATRYPEAYPLREVTAKQVANALLHFFSHVGIPK